MGETAGQPRASVLDEAAAAHEADYQAAGEGTFTWVDPDEGPKRRLALDVIRTLPRPVRLLDYGCGNGRFTAFFHQTGCEAIGTDVSQTAIALNRQEYPHLSFSAMTGTYACPYDDQSFDAVFCSEVIEHVYDGAALLTECRRLLRPGGLVLLTTPHHGRLKNVLTGLFSFEKHFDPFDRHIRFWTRNGLARACQASGLVPVRWDYIGRWRPVARSLFMVSRREG